MEIETGDAGAWQRAPAFFYSSKLKDRLAMNKLLIPAFCVLALLLAACGGGGSKSTSESGASVGLLVGDAPTDSLSSATLTITELRLVRENLQLTSNLLAAPRTLDVLGLGRSAREALLDLSTLGSGRYIGVRMTVDETAVVLRDLDGDPVSVNVVQPQAIAEFSSTRAADLFLAKDGYASISVDVVLDQSLQDNGIGFDFELTLRAGHATATPILDDFQGQVTAIHRSARWFEAEILDARGTGGSLGEVRVEVEDADLLFNFSGAAFGNSNAFLASLKVGDFVEVEGALTRDGTLDATRCEIEDRNKNQVRMEGRVLSADLVGQTFEIVLEEIEKGYPIAQPVLAALGNPGVLSIEWDNRTSWLGSKSAGGAGAPEDLVPGKKVDVRIDADDFVAPMPFLARNVRVDLAERYEGEISDVAALPNGFELTLDNSHPGVTSGRITGPVAVELDGNTVIFLDTGVEPWLEADDLLTGMEIEAAGKLTGSGAGASLDATRVEVKPGRLTGVVQSVSETEARFTVVVTDLDDPFGDPEPGATVDIILPSEAVLDIPTAGNTIGGLRTVFNDLAAGESLIVEVEGVSNGVGQVLGYEVEAEIEGD